MDLQERIFRYLAACPPSISGSGGHNATFTVACALINGFGLHESEAMEYLRSYNQRCQPPWSEAELEHKIRSAAAAQHSKLKGHLLGNGSNFSRDDFKNSSFPAKAAKPVKPTIDPVTAIENYLKGHDGSEADLCEASPIRPDDDFTKDAGLIATHLFRPGEFINVVTKHQMAKQKDGSMKPIPSGYGEFMERDEAVDYWGNFGGPDCEAGGWMRINPTDGKSIKDKDVVNYRHLLLEFDCIPVELQISFFTKLPLPISCILTSGGKSVHAWVRLDAKDYTDFQDSAVMVFKYLERFGIDGQNKNPARLSRLVGATRRIGQVGDGRQRLLYLSPNPTQRPIL
jgi:hypothetical protein